MVSGNWIGAYEKTLLERYGALLVDYNRHVNLVSRKDIDNLWERHILPSAVGARVFSWPKGLRVADIGSGGGFPGMVLAIFQPQCVFHLIESIGKKARFLEAVVDELKLPNVQVWHQRAELMPTGMVERVTGRAVAAWGSFLPWAVRLLVPGGDILYWTGKPYFLPPAGWEVKEYSLQPWLPFLGDKVILQLRKREA
ncbi:MAG: 16S rRNA (guanine(527)-N(7))-methyltransferase RsmG [Bacteroidia bacterium]